MMSASYLSKDAEKEVLKLMLYSDQKDCCAECFYYFKVSDDNPFSCDLHDAFRLRVSPGGLCRHYEQKEAPSEDG